MHIIFSFKHFIFLLKFGVKILFFKQLFMRKGKGPDPDPYLWLIDPEPRGPKTFGSCGSGSTTLKNSGGFFRFSSKPPVSRSGVEDNKLSTAGKKKTKELKVLDAKAAQNLSVVLGMRTSLNFSLFFIVKKISRPCFFNMYGVKYHRKAQTNTFYCCYRKKI